MRKNMKKTTKRRLSVCLSFILALGLFYTASPSNSVKVAKAVGYGLSNPRIDNDGVATWDCIYFGNYWQNDTNGDGKADQSDAKQPIKWRVLSVDGDDAFLLADQNLDCQPYNEKNTNVTWETCTLRQWLNHDFYQNAFDSDEQSAVQTTTVVNEDNLYYGTEGGNNTSDKVYLLSLGEASNVVYGFHEKYRNTETRESKNTEYAEECGGSPWWWLRSPGDGSGYAADVYDIGFVNDDGHGVNNDYDDVVRPALHLNLTSSKWSKAGTVSASGAGSIGITETPDVEETDIPSLKPNSYGLSNPTIDSDGEATWDCIYFGNYWQNDTNGDGKADQNDAKQPIKWRVLSVDGDDAILLADQNLDCQQYNEKNTNVTWETCTLRQWLNHDFYQNAFDSSEQSAVQITAVVNEDNPKYGTEGGNRTSDKVYLLSIGEASNTAYGFHEKYRDTETRESKNTEYAKECGGYTDSVGNGWWRLRSPGYDSSNAADVCYNGYFYAYGDYVGDDFLVVRPALHLNLTSSKWSKAGTVSSSEEISVEPTETPDVEATDAPNTKPIATSSSSTENRIDTPMSSETENKVTVTAPAKGMLKKCINKKGKKISLSWEKIKGAKGYQIQYADNKKFKKKKSQWTKKTTYTIKKLKKKKTYYVRVRAYKADGSKKVYGSFSKVKKVKIKK